MTPYDTYNLRHSAHFCVPIFSGIKWVPVNILGKTRYTAEQIYTLGGAPPEKKRKAIACLYEAVQLMQLNKFLSRDDNRGVYDDNILWSLHTDGRTAAEVNAGCCASVANWMVYMLDSLYDEVGIVSIISDIGVGHAVNYMRNKSSYYILDANAFLDEHKEYIRPETGCLLDFRKSKILTGAFFQADSLEDFSTFFSTYVGRVKKRTFLYSCHPGEIRWEGFRKWPSDHIEIYLPKGSATIIGTPPANMTVQFSKIPPASSHSLTAEGVLYGQ
ncbi:MAG: hypothetical protein ACLSVG_07420 [Clostridia bacterium]